MNDTRFLIGSLSNDLIRVATLTQRGSTKGAKRFLQEAKSWAEPLARRPVKDYIRKLARDVAKSDPEKMSMKLAERYLMYGILLQNYALHFETLNPAEKSRRSH